MSVHRMVIGVVLVVGGVLTLFLIFGFSTLTAGDLEEGSREWWRMVLGAVFDSPETYLSLAAMIGGVATCLDRPGRRMTAGQWTVSAGISAILLGLFLRAALRERPWMEGRSPRPDGTMHVVRHYRNWFGHERTVETVEP